MRRWWRWIERLAVNPFKQLGLDDLGPGQLELSEPA
jgi:hypothetical protein